MDPLTRLVHLLALATYAGSTLALVAVFLPTVTAEDDPAMQRRLLARGLRPYNVLSVGALGVFVISGASAITDLKSMLGPHFAQLIWPLAGKLALSFALIMVGTYVSFGLAHRLVRAEQGRLPIDPAVQRGMLRRLRGGCLLALALVVWTTWVGIGLRRPVPAAPPPAAAPAVPD
jgi:hypothetical protein